LPPRRQATRCRPFIEDVAPDARQRVAAGAPAFPLPRGSHPVAAFEGQPETARGRVTYRLLLRAHAAVRSDLERVERLAAQALDIPADELRREVDDLKRNGTLWKPRIDCPRYCHFVHSHHNAEDVMFFPELRETTPAINPVIDRLEADHRRLARPRRGRGGRQAARR
jgi:hypothetical protein